MIHHPWVLWKPKYIILSINQLHTEDDDYKRPISKTKKMASGIPRPIPLISHIPFSYDSVVILIIVW
jgi:hypothetical protein